MGRNKKKTEEEITKIEDDKGEQPDDTERNKKKTEEEITKIEDDKEMCPDIKKWLLGGSLENNCYYTGSGCPRCFGKTYRCSFDYKKKGCDKKTITNKKDAVQELVDMELISEEEKTKIEGKKGVLRTIKNLENPLHCCEKKRRNPVTKTVTKINKSTKDPQDETPREKEETKKTKLNTKKTKQEPNPRDKKKKRTETEKNKKRRKNNRTVRGRAKNVIWISRS